MGTGLVSAAKAGVDLKASDPVWPRCRTRGGLAFLAEGAWGALRWALNASPSEVQILDGLAVELEASGLLRVSFWLPSIEWAYAAGSRGFLVSVVDNTIVTGPHALDTLVAVSR